MNRPYAAAVNRDNPGDSERHAPYTAGNPIVQDAFIVTSNPDPSYKTVRLMLTVFAGLLLLAGLASALLLRRIGADYSRLVSQTAASLDAVQDVAYHAGVGYASLVDVPLTRESASRVQLLRALDDARAANDKVFANLGSTIKSAKGRACLDEVLARRLACQKEAESFIAWAESGDLTTEPLKWRSMLERFIEYQQACDGLSTVIRDEAVASSQELAEEIERLRFLYLGLGVLPIALGAVLVLVMVFLIRVTPPEVDLH